MIPESKYEAVIGLEIHVQLQTLSKAFSSDSIEYGALPNTQVSPISLGHPGTLPMHNTAAVHKAIMIGLALNSEITRFNRYARKNYFYADLPKGYQITQFDTPLCVGGNVDIKLSNGEEKSIRLTRIHMEEDTGKSMHDQDMYDTLVDYNRAGTALIEIVSEPDIRTGDEAYAFVSEIRRLVRYLDICDGNMEEGSLRCDANVSIRPIGSKTFGTKVEVKNMNSISNVKRAIDFEIRRQAEILDSAGLVIGETRGFNGLAGTTFSLRKKEGVTDYRYFPEPDLPPTVITDEMLVSVRASMPELPRVMFSRFTANYGLSDYDASVLIDDKHSAQYFEKIVSHTQQYKQAANWVTGPIRGYLNENALGIEEFVLTPTQIADILSLIEEGIINHTSATQQLFPKLLDTPNKMPRELVDELGLTTVKDSSFIEDLIRDVLGNFPDKVIEYKNGKVGLIGLFVGEVMKKSQGKADPKSTNELVRKILDEA
ncbi:MAG: Asp-tRNA(Asn)/Glu-tRNA(Gln) amidotransferase subunit GatB [Bacteroidota bacterium]|jgi:aspartyl-tRNA(Asn)/glutamyl-tRNA(Gln) amidotransferase subunit B